MVWPAYGLENHGIFTAVVYPRDGWCQNWIGHSRSLVDTSTGQVRWRVRQCGLNEIRFIIKVFGLTVEFKEWKQMHIPEAILPVSSSSWNDHLRAKSFYGNSEVPNWYKHSYAPLYQLYKLHTPIDYWPVLYHGCWSNNPTNNMSERTDWHKWLLHLIRMESICSRNAWEVNITPK